MFKIGFIIVTAIAIIALVVIGILISRRKAGYHPPKQYDLEADKEIIKTKQVFKKETNKINQQIQNKIKKIDDARAIKDESKRLKALADLANSM